MVLLCALFLAVQAATGPDIDASRLRVGAGQVTVAFDGRTIKGDPVRLAWSPDGRQFYLQAAQRARTGAVTSVRHYTIDVSAGSVKEIDEEPAWASKYWAWKAGQHAPGTAAFKIDVEQDKKVVTSTATPMGGGLARGAGDPGSTGISADDAAAMAYQRQAATVFRLRLKGELLGEWVNTPVIPGLTFGWAPAPARLIVFADPQGRLMIMDNQGRKQPVAEAANATLPGWSEDGKRLAYLRRGDRKTFQLVVVDVAQP